MQKSLLQEIAHCPIMLNCLADPGSKHPCSTLVNSQKLLNITDHQLPEPWNGDIEKAPILLLSSNPSISVDEQYPTESWEEEQVSDFFSYRFGGGNTAWVKDGKYYLRANSTYSEKATLANYWIQLRSRAGEIFNCPANKVRPGFDFALSEVVHCKSKKEKEGVTEALAPCVERYFDRLMTLSGAKIICVGALAAKVIRTNYNLPSTDTYIYPIQIGGKLRHLLFIPHPAGFSPKGAKKTFTETLTPAQLTALRREVGS